MVFQRRTIARSWSTFPRSDTCFMISKVHTNTNATVGIFRMRCWWRDEMLMAFGIDDSCFVEEAEFTPEESKCCFGANSRAAYMDSWKPGQYPRAGMAIRCDFDTSTLSAPSWVRSYDIIREALEASTFSYFIMRRLSQVISRLQHDVHWCLGLPVQLSMVIWLTMLCTSII